MVQYGQLCSNMSSVIKFDPLLVNYHKVRQIYRSIYRSIAKQASMAKHVQLRSIVAKYGQVCPECASLTYYGLVWPICGQLCSVVSKYVRNGQVCLSIDNYKPV